MNLRVTFYVLLGMALLLVPGIVQARYLNANTGRFLTMDTFTGNNQDPLSLHKYLYCQNNPLNMIDPSGRDGTGTAIGLGGTFTVDGILEGITLPAINGARVWSMTKIAATSVAIALTLTGDENNQKKGDIVYRRLSSEQTATPWTAVGIVAANPLGFTSPTAHILGAQQDLANSPWISTTRWLSVAREIYIAELNPIIEIDLKKVPFPWIDYTIPSNLLTLDDNFARSLAATSGEVLVYGYIPPTAIVGEVK